MQKQASYFENFLPEYGESQHDLRHNNIRLPAIRCEYEKINAPIVECIIN